MLKEGGPKAVKFYLDLLTRIEQSAKEFHEYREEQFLKITFVCTAIKFYFFFNMMN